MRRARAATSTRRHSSGVHRVGLRTVRLGRMGGVRSAGRSRCTRGAVCGKRPVIPAPCSPGTVRASAAKPVLRGSLSEAKREQSEKGPGERSERKGPLFHTARSWGRLLTARRGAGQRRVRRRGLGVDGVRVGFRGTYNRELCGTRNPQLRGTRNPGISRHAKPRSFAAHGKRWGARHRLPGSWAVGLGRFCLLCRCG
jgi:hypothetical protein